MRVLSLSGLPALLWLCVSGPSLALAQEVIEEIIVTADFRERPASQMPVSVSVLDGQQVDDLALQHFEELVNVIPNLNWSGDGNRARYFQIRGVGELEQYEGAPNPSVGFLVDDIDFSGIGTIATLFDIERIEVLRGPQGTRYGANALGGLIYMRSAAPTAEFRGRAELTVGGYDMRAAGIAVGGPINGSSGYRFSAHRHESNGFRRNSYLGRDDTNGRNETTLRGRLHWSASKWDFEFASLYVDIDDGYDAFALDNSYTVLSDKPGKDAQRSAGASLRAEYAGWDQWLLTSITSLADSDIRFSFDADWGNDDSWSPVLYDYVSLNDRQRGTLSQEFRLVGKNWLMGVYASRLDDELATLNRGDYYDPFYDWADSLFDPFDSDYRASSASIFAQRDMSLGASTRASIGMRVERRRTDYADSAGLTAGPTDSLWGGELTLSHVHANGVTSYIGLSKGYKAGGFNLGNVPDGHRGFEAEALWNFEAGIKTGAFDERIQVNASVFANRRIDQQVRTSFQLVPGDPASFVFVTVNADRGDTLGAEADIAWHLGDRWMIYAGIGLLDATFEKFDERPDLVGRAQAHAPRVSLSAGAHYSHPGGMYARVDFSARDRFYFDVSHNQKSSAYGILNAKIGFESDSWSAGLWARNFADRKYPVRGFYFGNEPPDFPDTLYTRLGDPRQIGITVDKRF